MQTKTLSTTKGKQLLGNSVFKTSVVKQNEALVFFATSLYFFEWKKVKSFLVDEARSLISWIFFL